LQGNRARCARPLTPRRRGTGTRLWREGQEGGKL